MVYRLGGADFNFHTYGDSLPSLCRLIVTAVFASEQYSWSSQGFEKRCLRRGEKGVCSLNEPSLMLVVDSLGNNMNP